MKTRRTIRPPWRRAAGLAGVLLIGGALAALAGYPLSADIESVSGRWTGGQAELVWTTGSEFGTAGYRVFRVDAEGEVPLHDGTIPADITSPSSTYTLVDGTRKRGTEATYRLEELRGDGRTLTLGVWTVRFEEDAEEPVAVLSPEQSERPKSSSKGVSVTGPAVKLPVISNDIYSVSFASVAAGLGLTPAEVGVKARDALLAMRCGNEPVAYLVDAPLERILFYGWGATNRYTRRNVFWIEPGAGMHMQRVSPASVAVPTNQTFFGRQDFEQDLVSMVEHSGVLRDDLYFWTHIDSGNASTGERTFEVPLGGYASGSVTFTVRLTGWNETPSGLGHKAEVRFNNTLLGEVLFDGKADVSAVFTAAAGTVLPSGNQLKIKGILQDGVISSTIVVDGFEVAYQQYYAPRVPILKATDGGHARLSSALFTDPLVLDVTDPLDPVWIADAAGVLPSGWSWPVAAGTAWALRERSGIPAVEAESGGNGGWMRATTNAVDYLVIAPRAFKVPAQALADYRASLGLRSAVAVFEDICDQFGGGLATPEAIRDFLVYARQQWGMAPWMVVLGGWGHYDYFNAQTALTSYLPSLLGSDSATLRPSDSLFGDVAGADGVPDLAVGRLPVQSVTQFNAYITKLKAYEAAAARPRHAMALLAADNADGGGDFTASNLEMGTEAKKRYTLAYTSLDSNTVAGVRADIRAAITNGSGMIHYTGHGSYRQLADENLLHYDDVVGMTNSPLLLFASMTCLIGRFDIYLATQRCLAEALVLQPNGGALAVYAPAGLSWNSFAGQFSHEFHRIHADERVDTIGPLLQQTRRSFGVLGGLHADAIRTYNLLGDPALKLRGGEGNVPPAWINMIAHWRWERFTVSELADPVYSLAAIRDFVTLHGYLALSPTNREHSSASVTGQTVGVTAIVPWTATSQSPWITITGGSSGINSGTVTYRIETNSGAVRHGSLSVTGGGLTRIFTVTQAAVPAPSGWDSGYQSLVGGWRRLTWFGDYVPMGPDGWVWHNKHGFIFVPAGGTAQSVWMYTQDMGWLWTGSTTYPFLYRASPEAWLWYNGARNPRWFINMTSGKWERW
jgi:hypothetical protein